MATMLNSQRGIVSAQLLCQLAQEEGMALAEVLAGSGISIATLGNAHSRILARQELRLIQNIVAHLPNIAGMGIRLGQRYRLANYGVFGFGLSSSATLQEAALFGLRFMGLSYAFSRFELRFTTQKVQMHFAAEELPAEVRPFVIERDMSALMSLVHEITGAKQACTKVRLSHGDASAKELAQEQHFGIMPQFACAENMAEIALEVFAQPLPQADKKTHSACALECEALLAELQLRQGWPERVRYVIEHTPNLAMDMESVAQQLFVSSRTLRRHLQAHKTSYRELLESVREQRAKELLGHSQLSVKEIAEQLGYQEPASFVHAFKRWTKSTPTAWRGSY